MTDTDLNTTDRIVGDAQDALNAIDAEVQRLRDEKLHISGRIAKLLNDRKPLSRIVNAAKGRNGHGTDQPQ